MVHDTPPYGHAPIPNIIDLSKKKPLFDLEVKGQGPTKVFMVCNTPPYGHAPTYQISLTYLERNIYLTLRSKVKVQQRSLWYATHHLMDMHHIPNIIDLSQKKQLFDLQDKCQGPNKGIYGTRHTSYGHAPTYQISLTILERQKMLWPEQENTI
jgi:hypothetical protein